MHPKRNKNIIIQLGNTNLQEDKRKCGPLYKSNIIFCADIGRQEEAIEESKEPATSNAKNVSIHSKRRIRVHVLLRRERKRKKEAKLHHFLMVKKVKMKLHPQMNKYGLCCKKTKMKALSFTIVSLAKTMTSRCRMPFEVFSEPFLH